MNIKTRSSLLISAMLPALAWMAACSPEVLPPSGTHPPTLPANVKIYQTQPSKYELLGTVMVDVTPDMKWDEHGDSTPGFEALKAKAAAMGANGVLLKADASVAPLLVGAGYNGTFYTVPLRRDPKTAFAQAIWVIKE